jgi:hypothetical protein
VLSDEIVVRITARPGETFLDRMIALVEGAERQKTPNEIALSILLAGLTIIFLLAVVTLQPFAIYSGAEQSIIVLVALLVCLIPTTIGALLSAIGIAGMDRLFQKNVIAFRSDEVRAAVNIGDNTAPETFKFSGNVWHCIDRPDDTRRLVRLPGAETDGTYGTAPRFRDAAGGDIRIQGRKPTDAGVREVDASK